MTGEEPTDELLEIVDAADLRTLSWGLLRVMFPRFAERVELERHVRALLATGRCHAVRTQQHRQDDGQLSAHIFDVYRLDC
jgi:hypothetical protein